MCPAAGSGVRARSPSLSGQSAAVGPLRCPAVHSVIDLTPIRSAGGRRRASTPLAPEGPPGAGGVGFDISCDVRLLATDLVRSPRTSPRHVGGHAGTHDSARHAPRLRLPLTSSRRLREILTGGASYVVAAGHEVPREPRRCEDGGVVPGADPGQASERAVERGLGQVGSPAGSRIAGPQRPTGRAWPSSPTGQPSVPRPSRPDPRPPAPCRRNRRQPAARRAGQTAAPARTTPQAHVQLGQDRAYGANLDLDDTL
ncbi:RtcB family protein [Amycolatopsis sp. NPDC049253]|uniref:RtcB family protein n=1 Tax=Amycolatopsis sp. NPDC049253 TaxID=3155274 RepID=UPI00342A53DA